jgi:hypothetical protein
MDILLFIFGLIVFFTLLGLALLAGAFIWFRRGRERVRTRFGDATTVIRMRGADPRFTDRLRDVAEDPRTPASARAWLERLVRYRRDPIVLAPEWVPVLGGIDEVVIESFLLRQAWRSLPHAVWVEHFPDTGRGSPRPKVAPATNAVGLAALLGELEVAGRHDELLRTLDRRLPPWPISTNLIDTGRELLELERNLDAARQRGVPEAVTERLTGEARLAADALWDLADRLSVTASFGVPTDGIASRLEEESARINELGTAVREARTGLAELMLAGATGRQSLDRAERRFRALARTATELRELDA